MKEKECSDYASLITAFIDHELDESEKQNVESHLKVCGPCNNSYLHEMRIKQVVNKRLKTLNAPEYLFQRIHRQLFSDEKKPSFFKLVQTLFFYRPLAASMAVAALILIATFPTYLLSINRNSSAQRLVTFLEQNGEAIELQGQIICIDCELPHRDAHNRTPHTLAHRTGIRCSANQIWSFLDTHDHQELLHDHKYLQKKVLVSGIAYQNAHYVYVKNYRLL